MNNYDIVKKLNIDHKTILRHLRTRLDAQRSSMSRYHMIKNLINRISICELLLKQNEIEHFQILITGNEKWITYDNNVRKR